MEYWNKKYIIIWIYYRFLIFVSIIIAVILFYTKR